ncbi:MAG TPA: beta-propeller domain-containing protein, partial [Mycobacteriales bacterium]|nr:beta-propeller domain-containing protein [Mycobacteriales bacterium]
AAPAAPPAHSTTTVHEAGVDEPDVVKTDGRRLVSVVDGRLRVVDLASREVTTVAGLPAGPSTRLLLHGDRALVVVGDGPVWRGGPGPGPDVAPGPAAGVRFVLVDLAAGRVLDTLTVDGAFVDGRQVGGVARLVVRSGPRLRFVQPDQRRSPDAARSENRRIVARSALADWLPRYELDRGGVRQEGRLLDCARLSHPAAYTGSSMVTVLTVDLAARLGTGDPVGVVADGEVVYGTATSLYVAAQEPPAPTDEPVWGPAPLPRAVAQRVQVHKLDLPGTGRPRYVASGSVAGWLLNQYSLSEHDGRLRVATTQDLGNGRDACCDGPPRTESAVTVLAQRGDRLVQVGRLGGLGKGERIYAVRFLGPVGYVVTFRQTDPLYTVDLSDPARPRAVGELKIPGYSAYLHPTGPTTLLGVGQEATGQGRRLGTQVSLFDVGDPARPRRTAQHHVAAGQSEVEFDPHAFLWWPAARIAVLPVQAPVLDGSGGYGSGALVLRVGDGRLDPVGTVRHPGDGPVGYPRAGVIRRSLVVGDTLWTVSDRGARAVAVADLAERAWVPFR